MPLELPEDFEGAETLSHFEDTASLAKAYKELERKLGSTVPKPTSEEGLMSLLEKLGAPSDPNGYQVPEGVDPSSLGELGQWAAEARLTPEQFARVAEKMHAQKAAEFEQSRAKIETEQSEVQRSYGDGFQEAAARVALALKNMPEEQRAIYDPEDPAQFRLLEQIGKGLTPSPLAPQSTPGQVNEFDPKVVAEEARKILESPAFSDRFHPEHQRAKDEYASRAQALVEANFDGCYDPRLVPERPAF